MWLLFLIISASQAQVRLETIDVNAPRDVFASSVRADTQDGKILSGKKISTTQLDQLPTIATNNYRQALSQTSGLMTAEVGNEAFSSLSYRGLGDPHETPNIQTLMDGLPISADMYGSPNNYFIPPFQAVDKIEFLRGGAALLYGPQIGGALNYIMRRPVPDKTLAGRLGLIVGQRNSINSYNEVSGTRGNTSYMLTLNHRQSDGWRDQHTRSGVQFVQAHLEHRLPNSDTIWARGNVFNGSYQTPGGLGLHAAANTYSFDHDRYKNPLRYDHLEIQRQGYSFGWKRKRDLSEWQVTVFGGHLARDSFSQTRGAAPVVQGAIYQGNTNVIQRQDFNTAAAETRYLRHWTLGPTDQTFTGGLLTYNMRSPYREEQGQRASAGTGILQKRLVRQSIVNSVFFENRTSFGKWTITPGARFENIRQTVDEQYRGAAELRDVDQTNNVSLRGLAITYALTDEWEIYGNASEAYTPVSFATAVPTGATDTISSNIKASNSDSQEIGVRGESGRVRFDASVFQIYYANLFGRDGTRFINTGAGLNRGLETAVQWRAWEKVELYVNSMWLQARFVNGPNRDNTPQYAPHSLTRGGIVWRPTDKDKLALMGTWVARQWGDDANSSSYRIPGYEVYDLTFEKNLGRLSLVGGINNLLDRKYFSRVRGQGIDPGLPRNVYAGLQVPF